MHSNPETPQLEPVSAESALGQENAAETGERTPETQYCIFRCGRERFCLRVLDIEEVVEWPTVTNVPLSPSFLMGIFNLRGGIVPVVDIAFTEGRRADLLPRHCVVASLFSEEGEQYIRLGIATDEVIGTYTTQEPLLVEEAPRDVPHCNGMLRHGEGSEERLALSLDLRKLFAAFPVPVI